MLQQELGRLARRALCAFLPRLAVCLPSLDREELGLAGEELAARALARAGWRVLGRRVRTPRGEVDLFVERGPVRAVVEVKAGRLPVGLEPAAQRFPPGLRVDEARLARLRRAARFLGVREGRVDLVEVVVHPRGLRVELRHHAALRSAPGRAAPRARWPRGVPRPGRP